MDVINLDSVPAFTTKDGSEIRELLAYRNSAIRNQSLAKARVPVGWQLSLLWGWALMQALPRLWLLREG